MSPLTSSFVLWSYNLHNTIDLKKFISVIPALLWCCFNKLQLKKKIVERYNKK